MGSFLRPLKPTRVVVEVPMAIPTDAEYSIIITPEAYETKEISIRVDGELYLTIQRDGHVMHHPSGQALE